MDNLFSYLEKKKIPITNESKKSYLETCLASKDSAKALEYLRKERPPVHKSLYKVGILTCASTGDYRRAHEIFNMMKASNIAPFLGPWNAIIDAYAVAGDLGGARKALKQMESVDGVAPDISTFDRLLKACVKLRDYDSAVEIWNEISERGLVKGPSTWAHFVKVKPLSVHYVYRLILNPLDNYLVLACRCPSSPAARPKYRLSSGK